MTKKVCVTGGCGFIGSMLVPKLLSSGHEVNVLDPQIYGNGLKHFAPDPKGGSLQIIKADTRDHGAARAALRGCHVVIHLASISNDPCFDLDETWCREMDVDTFEPLVKEAKRVGVERFIYASSSSVYGSKGDAQVTEDAELEPITNYSRSKIECERILTAHRAPGFATCILRPATVCGYSYRQRLDVVVNLLTAAAWRDGEITVDGGAQYRANLHMEDMTDLYVQLVTRPEDDIDGKVWNVGAENLKVMDIAKRVQSRLGNGVRIVTNPVVDQRSYRVCSDRIREDIGFVPQWTVEQAIDELCRAFAAGAIGRDIRGPEYVNKKRLETYIPEDKARARAA